MKPQNQQQQIEVCVGEAGVTAGTLVYTQQGQRSHSAFRYSQAWLSREERFSISPDLPLTRDYQLRKASSAVDSVFHLALADTAPDAWGRRVIARDHAKRRAKQAAAAFTALTEMDYLLAVDDVSRVGALRLRDASGNYVRKSEDGARTTPPFIELQRMYEASRAVERGTDSSADLTYLQGKGTSLGGMRPKCTVLDENGKLAIGKFPSIGDVRSVTKGEVLAMRLAKLAGIDVAPARIALIDGTPVAVIERFDRMYEDVAGVKKVTGRIPYLSAASMLQASRQNDHSYTEIADAIRANGSQPTTDVQQLWRRMVFNHLIANVDDHLQNHGFLHTAQGQWRLAPAFDINPFPDKERESKTWLSEADGPITSLQALLGRASYFALASEEAKLVLAQVQTAVQKWRKVAQSKAVGLTKNELDDFAPAFLTVQ
jgi:serine/threonine-protein kinase HipA